MKNLLKNPYLLFNIDVVGAKSGKNLTKIEKAINYVVNLLALFLSAFVFCVLITFVISLSYYYSEFIIIGWFVLLIVIVLTKKW
jgi:hypothetical protein